MLSNISSIIPRILLSKKDDGAIISMALGLIAGLLLIYVVISFFNKYPGKGLPELLKNYSSKWLYIPVLFLLSIMSYIAGLITLATYTFILATFLSPETLLITTVFPFLLVLSYGILMKSKSILYSIEIVLILFLPIGVFVFLKAYSSKQLEWDFVKVAVMHVNSFPNYDAFTASLFLFSGVLNMTIFNQFFLKKHTFGIKQLLVIGSLSIFTLFTTYFMPIGFGGFDEIDKLLYPWISTTDSVRMGFGVIERLVFIFMLFFISISFMSIVIHWHVSAQFLKSIVQFKKMNWKGKNLTLHSFALLFGIGALIFINTLTNFKLYQYSILFYNTLPVLVVILLISMLSVNRGAKL